MDIFFSQQTNIHLGDKIFLKKNEYHHAAHVMRKKQGDNLIITDGKGSKMQARIVSLDTKSLSAIITSKEKVARDSNNRVSLFVGMLKSMERFRVILEKSSELGVTDIYPMETEHTVLSINDWSKRRNRCESIICSACKQSRRYWFPVLHDPLMFQDAMVSTEGDVLFFYEKEKRYRDDIDVTKSVSLFVGSEGGFSNQEVEWAEGKGAKVTGLGKETLRTETAALVALSLVRLKVLSGRNNLSI